MTGFCYIFFFSLRSTIKPSISLVTEDSLFPNFGFDYPLYPQPYIPTQLAIHIR